MLLFLADELVPFAKIKQYANTERPYMYSTLTAAQRSDLETAFRLKMYPDTNGIDLIAKITNLSDASVRSWFQNRRKKYCRTAPPGSFGEDCYSSVHPPFHGSLAYSATVDVNPATVDVAPERPNQHYHDPGTPFYANTCAMPAVTDSSSDHPSWHSPYTYYDYHATSYSYDPVTMAGFENTIENDYTY